MGLLDALRHGECTVGELTKRVQADGAIVSQQLAVLRSKNLVRFCKDGNFVRYSVTDPAIFDLLDAAWRIFEHQIHSTQRVIATANQANLLKSEAEAMLAQSTESGRS
ncbi:MAG: helix-turn-helix transcriptional regulator [Cyanobacteria bacterium NC_groundwater_1444_Ag_S-0.65um_54_12]|nr:helix-turn-helix transcriptional regulator [Cyanobacteria bacterium NC_groundwater_1444_Ag_S-0.65um_54_12]